jgi:hypothetical protein
MSVKEKNAATQIAIVYSVQHRIVGTL